MSGQKFVITGASGWIGRALLDVLGREFGPSWASQVTAFGSSARRLNHRRGQLDILPLEALGPRDTEGAIVFHLAYLTKERLGCGSDGAFIAANLAIDQRVLEAIEVGMPAGLFIASSGAASDAERDHNRNVYGVAKLLQEDRFLAYAARSKTPTIVGRIFNIAGPFANKIESYALSSFISQAISFGRISISAATPVYRSYVHVIDLIEIIIEEIRSKERGYCTRLDIAGPLVVEMYDVAAAVAIALGFAAREIIERVPLSDGRPSLYLGDTTGLRSLALRQGRTLRPFDHQVRDTIEAIRGNTYEG